MNIETPNHFEIMPPPGLAPIPRLPRVQTFETVEFPSNCFAPLPLQDQGIAPNPEPEPIVIEVDPAAIQRDLSMAAEALELVQTASRFPTARTYLAAIDACEEASRSVQIPDLGASLNEIAAKSLALALNELLARENTEIMLAKNRELRAKGMLHVVIDSSEIVGWNCL